MAKGTNPAIHATAVSIDGRGVIITGPSGSGKSDLALRLIDRGAMLVSDDYVILEAAPAPALMRAPANIAGKIEIRGVGIVDVPFVDNVPAHLHVQLDGEGERLPQELATTEVCGHSLPTLAINPFHPSAVIKIEHMLKLLNASDTEGGKS